MGSGSNPTEQKQHEIGTTMNEVTTQNNFDVLSIPKEQPSVLEEGEVTQAQDQPREENKALA